MAAMSETCLLCADCQRPCRQLPQSVVFCPLYVRLPRQESLDLKVRKGAAARGARKEKGMPR